MARGLKIRIEVVEGFHYTCKENKGADLLQGNCAADRRFLVSHMQKAAVAWWLMTWTPDQGVGSNRVVSLNKAHLLPQKYW